MQPNGVLQMHSNGPVHHVRWGRMAQLDQSRRPEDADRRIVPHFDVHREHMGRLIPGVRRIRATATTEPPRCWARISSLTDRVPDPTLDRVVCPGVVRGAMLGLVPLCMPPARLCRPFA